ncbi:TPA: YSIRK-type signal peptide-containing protein [Staphylococcus pseudintermedius]|nr:YSIRK-type signal peptide-containing protein [Staphylococcus pseudintermedius]
MKKNRKSKRLDFLPNKLNKYSIRKFTVGYCFNFDWVVNVFGCSK